MATNEVLSGWRKSQRCESSTCVEVAEAAGGMAMRDSAHPDGPVLHFSRSGWQGFVLGLRDGEFDRG
ncbi:DUF397 domain-containing protein [Phytohabitans kaempferiae]|uniref:DUF397 domain-containing protein n=1 Tax=Phytohabitans kaempferiae TaxID=1620943 RepID=A0ABV6M382_9ACTN